MGRARWASDTGMVSEACAGRAGSTEIAPPRTAYSRAAEGNSRVSCADTVVEAPKQSVSTLGEPLPGVNTHTMCCTRPTAEVPL